MTNRVHGKAAAIGTTTLMVGAVVAGVAQPGMAALEPGTAANDVTVGRDNDNAANPFIQPPGVVAKQHMDNTDVLFGRGGNDLLVGRLGGDTLLGGAGHDILVGGPERGIAPNSDVLVGDEGSDINVWAPGDGSDAYAGQEGYDTQVLAPFVLDANGSPKVVTSGGRRIPRVDIGGKPQFRCTIVPVPATQRLGAQFLVRFFAGKTLAVTLRQKDVERVLCPSPWPGHARVAYLNTASPKFVTVPLKTIGGTLGAIVARP